MSAVIDTRAFRRPEPVTAPATARPRPLAGFLRRVAMTTVLLYAILVLTYPPALTGRISVPTSPGSIVGIFDLAMAGLMPIWLVFPVVTGISSDAARAAAALAVCVSMAALCRR